MAIIKTLSVLLVISLSGCAAFEEHTAPRTAAAHFHISKPRVDVEHLRASVLEQPTFTLVANGNVGNVAVSKQPPTTAVVCSTGSSTDCKQTAIISSVTASLNATTRRVEGQWKLAYGSDVTAEYGTTSSIQYNVKQPGPTGSARNEIVPFSVALGESESLQGPFDMTLKVSVDP